MYRDAAQELDEHDRAVGAILIGEALLDDCDRAVALAREDAVARTHDCWRAIVDAHDAFPEVWRHLDRARRVLAARGGNTAAYDERRPHARRAATDPGLDGERALDAGAIDDARRAIAELKLAVPGADWDAIAARTQGLVRSPLVRRRRQRIGIAAIVGAFSLAVAGWLLAIVPEHHPSQRELMRDELQVISQQRKLKIVSLQGELGGRCDAPQQAHELMRLLVLDGRGADASQFASGYVARCGDDPVVDHWAHAPRPHP
ncbi:MAG: hypothetical protein ACM31C_16320 [Acidobacteriota bacterium]